MNLRILPWLLALLGLVVPLVGSGFTLWLPIGLWLVLLALAWLGSRGVIWSWEGEMIAALLLLPILFLLAWEGGWWLIPADLAWLGIAIAGRRAAEATRPGQS